MVNSSSTKNYRFLISDGTNVYRIFNVIFFDNDSHGEKYIKFSFPELATVQLATQRNFAGNKPYSAELTADATLLPSGINEYTYHYIGNRAHWKTVSGAAGNPYVNIRNIPSLDVLHAVSVFNITLFDLSFTKPYTGAIKENHIIFEYVFGDKPVSVEVSLHKLGKHRELKFMNADPHLTGVAYATIQEKDILFRAQLYAHEKKSPRNGLSIFQLEDPRSNIEITND